jgi:hypothetical protein
MLQTKMLFHLDLEDNQFLLKIYHDLYISYIHFRRILEMEQR